jgi:hypothetical protein
MYGVSAECSMSLSHFSLRKILRFCFEPPCCLCPESEEEEELEETNKRFLFLLSSLVTLEAHQNGIFEKIKKRILPGIKTDPNILLTIRAKLSDFK